LTIGAVKATLHLGHRFLPFCRHVLSDFSNIRYMGSAHNAVECTSVSWESV